MTDGTEARDEVLDELLSDFLDEASQLLDRLNEDLLVLDELVSAMDECQTKRCDDDLMNQMFRSAHSIKGLSAMLGLSNINRLTHKIENVFDAARKAELDLDRGVVQVVFEAVDHLSAMVNLLRVEGHDNHDASSAVGAIGLILQHAGCEREVTSQADAERALASEMAAAQPVADVMATPDFAAASTDEDVESTSEVDHFAGIVDETEVPTKYLAIFIDETEMSLDALSETLVSLTVEGMPAAVENVLITSHRIKGSAASVGLHRPAKLAHFMEDILQELRETHGALTPIMADAMLHCTDALRGYVAGLKTGSPSSDQFNARAHELLRARRAESTANTPLARMESPLAVSPPVPWQERLGNMAARYQDHGPLQAGRVVFTPGLALAGMKGQLICEKLCHCGELLACDPPAMGIDERDTLDELLFVVATSQGVSNLRGMLSIAGVQELEFLPPETPAGTTPAETTPATTAPPTASQIPAAVTNAPAPMKVNPAAKPVHGKLAAESKADSVAKLDVPPEQAPAEQAPAAKRAAPTDNAKPAETLRVDIERLDQLMNLAGQLVINKARFTQIGEGLKEAMFAKQTPQRLTNAVNLSRKLAQAAEQAGASIKGSAELEAVRSHARRLASDLDVLQRELARVSQMRAGVNDLFEAVHQLDRVADGIQKSVMDTRMVPIGPLFGRFKRVVRDITRLNDKDINLVIRGEKTELDKRMIDELGDPLIHMVRNAADHGIETPDARLAAGKPAQGTLTLDAFHRGNSIIIQVSDDGKGLDRDRILNKALEKKLISPLEAEKMTPQQIYQLIWEPGFSTAEKVTEISGRGMGMDIVRSKIEEISGTVEVDSTLGKGTTFTIKLPLTLAILPSLMSVIDGDVFALPVESIMEIVSVDRSDLCTVHGSPTAVIRGRVVSVVELSELFTWSRPPVQITERDPDECTLVVLGQEGKEIGLRVDVLLGEEDVVIKSMAENYRNVAGIAGASILGDGRVSLILDVAALIAMSSRQVAPV
jgi:two-component system chemotaxis sensor kinase CheA